MKLQQRAVLTLAAILTAFASSGAFAVTAVVISGDNQSARSGTAVPNPITLFIGDGLGNGVAGVSVQLVTVPAGPGGGDPMPFRTAVVNLDSANVTDATGRVMFANVAAVGNAGLFIGGVRVMTSSTTFEDIADVYRLQVTGAPTTQAVIVAGAGQSTPIGTRFAAPAVAQILDSSNTPVPGALVVLSLCCSGSSPGGQWVGGGSTSQLLAADERGMVVSPQFQANGNPGSWTFSYSTFQQEGGATLAGSSVMTNLPPSPAGNLFTLLHRLPSVGPTDPFEITVRLTGALGAPLANERIRFEIPELSPAAVISPGEVSTDAQGVAVMHAFPNGLQADYTIWGYWHDQLVTVEVHQVGAPPVPPWQDMWWAGPGESGWGMSIAESALRLFPVIFTYDASGAPTWFVMPAGNWSSSRKVFSGELYSPVSTPFFAYDAARFNAGSPVGVGTLTFTDDNHATFEYKINGVSGTKSMSRQPFGSGPSNGVPAAGMWWGGIFQNGWGVAILRQGNTLFSVWFTYDGAGHPLWYVMPGGNWTSSTTYEGTLYRAQGSPLNGYDVSRLRVTPVGTYLLRFVDGKAFFQYSADGHTGTLELIRQSF